MTNDGKWKGVSRRKKFKNDFLDPEDSFNDNFKIGMALKYSAKTNKSQIKLYEPFYESDIIVASPLAIRILTGQEADTTALKENKIDYDFLSSIEFLVLDKAEAFLF
jgi:U3 small nucleolar RNA-associated protein 25